MPFFKEPTRTVGYVWFIQGAQKLCHWWITDILHLQNFCLSTFPINAVQQFLQEPFFHCQLISLSVNQHVS